MSKSARRSRLDPVYRVVDMDIWADARFRSLSPMLPSGQSLWLRLLLHERNGPIPGLIVQSLPGLAAQLGWSDQDTRTCMDELVRAGMVKIDERAGIIWLPKAEKRNSPANPNIVKGWRPSWLMTPDCPLRREIETSLRETVGARFPEAFAFVFGSKSLEPAGNGWGNRSGDGSPNGPPNQESRVKNQENPLPLPAKTITDPKEAAAVVIAEDGRWLPCDHPHLQAPAQGIVDQYRGLSGSQNIQARALGAVVKLLAHRIAPELLLAAAKNYGAHCDKNDVPPLRRVGALTFYGQGEWRGWLVTPLAAPPRPAAPAPALPPPLDDAARQAAAERIRKRNERRGDDAGQA